MLTKKILIMMDKEIAVMRTRMEMESQMIEITVLISTILTKKTPMETELVISVVVIEIMTEY